MKGKLNLHTTLPANGLICFSGKDINNNKLIHVIEPSLPITKYLYRCDSIFHTGVLKEQLSIDDKKIGFIIIDGHGLSFHLLTNNVKTTLYKMDVQLPNKHNNGGQSQNRFARLRVEKRDLYITKAVELFTQYFLTNGLLNVNSLIFAGNASFKHDLAKKLHINISNKIIGFFDVQYGGENGFNQALELSYNVLNQQKLMDEKNILQLLFECIQQNTNCCYSCKNTMTEFLNGTVKTLIIWEDIKYYRYEITDKDNNCKIIYNKQPIIDGYKIISSCYLLDWLLEHHNDFGTEIKIITGISSIGTQFIEAFDGIGGILRYQNEDYIISTEDDYDYTY